MREEANTLFREFQKIYIAIVLLCPQGDGA